LGFFQNLTRGMGLLVGRRMLTDVTKSRHTTPEVILGGDRRSRGINTERREQGQIKVVHKISKNFFTSKQPNASGKEKTSKLKITGGGQGGMRSKAEKQEESVELAFLIPKRN